MRWSTPRWVLGRSNKSHLKESVGYSVGEGHFIARRRHIDALQRAHQHMASGRRQLKCHAGELLAEDLRQAQYALSEITGQFTSDDLLGQIFRLFVSGSSISVAMAKFLL